MRVSQAHEQSAAGIGQWVVVGVAADQRHRHQTLPCDKSLIRNGLFDDEFFFRSLACSGDQERMRVVMVFLL